jgi:hypothetical protein
MLPDGFEPSGLILRPIEQGDPSVSVVELFKRPAPSFETKKHKHNAGWLSP